MELKIKSKKVEGKFIYANIMEHKSSTTLVVFLGGLSGNDTRSLSENVSLDFFKLGFSILWFNFCNDDKAENYKANALEIWEMSFLVYAAELKNILDSWSKRYSTIIFVGHSFGAPISIMFLNKYKKYASKTKLVLWDPSLLPWGKEVVEEVFVFDPIKKLYIQKETENPLIINRSFYNELQGTKNTAEILRELNHKTCIIAAEKGAHEDAKKYFSKLRNKKSSALTIIKGANHLFDGKRVQKELFEKTLEFLKKS